MSPRQCLDCLVGGCGEYDEQLLGRVSDVQLEHEAGSRHTSNGSTRLMKLCGVIELFLGIGCARKCSRTGRRDDRWRYCYSSSEVTTGRRASILVRGGGRSDRGEMEGIACRSLMTARTRRSEPRNAIHAAMRAKN